MPCSKFVPRGKPIRRKTLDALYWSPHNAWLGLGQPTWLSIDHFVPMLLFNVYPNILNCSKISRGSSSSFQIIVGVVQVFNVTPNQKSVNKN